jgi:8-oxo-dGTP diphosphatase
MDYIDAADVALFAYNPDRVLHVLTITRRWDPYQGHKALPGGHVDPGEAPHVAAARELFEETGIAVPDDMLIPVGVYATPGRDPRSDRYRSFAFTLTVARMRTPTAADDALAAEWTPLPSIYRNAHSMAFDHRAIVLDAANNLGPIRAV